jgi:hypothetical protein
MKRLIHRACALAAVFLFSTSLAGCGKDRGQTGSEAITSESAITEKNGNLEVTWDVSPEGRVSMLVKDEEGRPISKGLSGAVTVAGKAAPLTPAGDGMLTGQIPKLSGDLTEVTYDVFTPEGSARGTVHLPRGGTKELVESAKEAAAAKPIPRDKKGPNGGVVQVVGDDIVEVVADKDSGAVRMYFLDDDLKVVPIGKRKGKIGFVGAAPVVVDLAPDPGGVYLVGKVGVKVDPVKITVVVIDGDEVDVALCHWAPGAVIVVGPAAPVIPVFIVTGWPIVVVGAPAVIVQPGVVIHQKGKGKGKGKFKVKGKGW